MQPLTFVFCVAARELETDFSAFFRERGVETLFSVPASGTATGSIRDYLGVENNAKTLFLAVTGRQTARTLLAKLVTVLGINLPGAGIAATVPVGSIGGSATLKYLTEGQNLSEEGEDAMNTKDMPYALITVIAEKGFSDQVMDAARSAGARGGTVVHAKGTGSSFTQKFFGVSIASEKEMIHIVTRRSDKDAIMKAILTKAGPATDAKAVTFSLPVENVVGLSSVALPEDGE